MSFLTNITPEHIIFYFFALLAIVSGMMVVAAKNPVRGVLFLVLAFFAMAGIWMLLRAEFLSLILVLVYVGAVMTLFLFVVMMLNIDHAGQREGFVRYMPLAVLVVAVVVGFIFMAIGPGRYGLSVIPAPLPVPSDYSNTAELGAVLYTNYAYPFEVAGVLLLTAIIAAITLSHRGPKQRKVQHIAKQIAVQRSDRVRLLKMPAEKKIKPNAEGSTE